MSPTNFCCGRCGSKSKIALYEDPKMKYGLSEKLMFCCDLIQAKQDVCQNQIPKYMK